MKENGGLGDLCLLELLVRSAKHYFRYVKAQNLVSLLEKGLCLCGTVVQVLAHSGELRTLARENVSCFHNFQIYAFFYTFVFRTPP